MSAASQHSSTTALARCGGPGLCQRCQADQARLSAAIGACPDEFERLLSLVGAYAKACSTGTDERAIAAREASRAEVKRWHTVVVAARESLDGGADAVGRLRQALAELDRGRS